jgi:dUTP pyrophosphatase
MNAPVYAGILNNSLKIKRLHPAAIMPCYQTNGAACFDLHAILPTHLEALNVLPGEPVTFRTGLAFEIPEGFCLLVFSRSGHGFKYDTRLANAVGVIDADYRGEVLVRLTSDGLAWRVEREEDEHLLVRQGDRIAQAMLVPLCKLPLIEVDDLTDTARGQGGFGSTGQ